MIKKLNLNKSIFLLQEIRVIHSLCENGVTIYCNQSEYDKLKPLIDEFNFDIRLGLLPEADNFTDVVKINHTQEPLTIIKEDVKSLIFPKSLIDFCQKDIVNKEDKIYFRGLLTQKRENAISIIRNKTNKPLLIDSSNNGREFPLKTFDRDYFNEMKKYKFILCPDGDFIWSYRFFESVMCGAIPIVENESPLFEGFKYYNIEDNLVDMVWKPEWVSNNLNLLVEKYTYKND